MLYKSTCHILPGMMFVLLFLSGCSPSDRDTGFKVKEVEKKRLAPGTIFSKPLPQRKHNPESPFLFEKLSASRTGVDFVTKICEDHKLELLNPTVYVIGGASIGDINGDELPDLFFPGGIDGNRLYVQTGDFRFKDIAESAGARGKGAWSVGAALVDIDNDGDLDIYVCNYDSPNQLFINEENGSRFVESAGQYGLDFNSASVMSA